MDPNCSKNIDVDDFRWGMMDLGVQISKDEAAEMLSSFDKDKCGMVHYEDFICAFKVSIVKWFYFICLYKFRHR